VSDFGPGFAAGDETRIFERFYRAGNSGATTGAGLGLSICKGIVEAHGGKIWAKNREGGGAVITFTIPINGQPPRMAGGEMRPEAYNAD
jgi:two-component system sensor histidine kinase KdpD